MEEGMQPSAPADKEAEASSQGHGRLDIVQRLRERGTAVSDNCVSGNQPKMGCPVMKEKSTSFHNTNHDAAPTARARTESATGEPGGGHGSDGTDKPGPRPVLGIGDTFSPIAKRESDRPDAIATPRTSSTPSEGTSHGGCTLTAEEQAAVTHAADLLIGSRPGATLRSLLVRTQTVRK